MTVYYNEEYLTNAPNWLRTYLCDPPNTIKMKLPIPCEITPTEIIHFVELRYMPLNTGIASIA